MSSEAAAGSADAAAMVAGCPVAEYRERRAALMKSLPPGALAIFPGASKMMMSRNIPYRFRQDSDMQYFSGFREPDGVLMVRSSRGSCDEVHSTLVLPPRNPNTERWDGPTIDVADVPELYGVTFSESLSNLSAVLQAEIAAADRIYLDQKQALPQSVRGMVTELVTDTVVRGAGEPVSGLAKQVDSLRAVKSAAEIALMATAAQQATDGIHLAMAASRPGITEHELAAIVDCGSRTHGAVGAAFPPVVGGGPRALILHYHPTPDGPPVEDGEMVLMDAGAEHLGYASDISRTWPVSGRFSDAQHELYSAVLRTQLACIDMCRADGATSLLDIQRASTEFTEQEAARLGLVARSDVGTPLGKSRVRELYPHSIGHYLGIDVHDIPSCPLNRPLEPGMVVTIEPGLYVPDTAEAPTRFRNLGIRIEDDVLITEDGPVVLSGNCVKSPKAIEEFLAEAVV